MPLRTGRSRRPARCRGSSPTIRRPRTRTSTRGRACRAARRVSAPMPATGPAATSPRVSSRTTTRPRSARSPTTTRRRAGAALAATLGPPDAARSPRRRRGSRAVLEEPPPLAAAGDLEGRCPRPDREHDRCRGRDTAADRQNRIVTGLVVGAVALVCVRRRAPGDAVPRDRRRRDRGVRALRSIPPRGLSTPRRSSGSSAASRSSRSPTTRASPRSRWSRSLVVVFSFLWYLAEVVHARPTVNIALDDARVRLRRRARRLRGAAARGQRRRGLDRRRRDLRRRLRRRRLVRRLPDGADAAAAADLAEQDPGRPVGRRRSRRSCSVASSVRSFTHGPTTA